ncbi:MAG: DNA polymerase III subunit delta [Clostridia bacterium]|nr:DNA polymerase III subunit delta [Clostridia bacterium]
MTIVELKQALAQPAVSGCFLFYGEEEYLKKHYRDALRKKVLTDDGLDALNHTIFDGDSVSMSELYEAVKAMPMMADHHLIEWHHANIENLKAAEMDNLLTIAEQIKEVYDYSILLICASEEGVDKGTPKRPGERLSKLSQVMQAVDFPPSSDGELLNWIARHFAHEKLTISPDARRHLLMRVGHSMQDLAFEISKVACYAHALEKGEVTIEDIDMVTSVYLENDTYALSNALLEGQVSLAFSALAELKSKRVDPAVVSGQLFRVWCDLALISTLLAEGKSVDSIAKVLKMNAYKVGIYVKAARRLGQVKIKAALLACGQTDLYCKSVYINAYDQLEKLLVELCK